jgi:hypothetical protein
MLVLALLIGQTLGLPEVEDPIPGKIGLSDLVSLAGAGGVLGAVLSFARPQKRDLFVRVGTFLGFCAGCGLYAISLVVQLLFGE